MFLKKNWAWLGLKGIIFSVFGIVALFTPAIALKTMVWYLGLVTLGGGVLLALGAILVKRRGGQIGPLVFESAVDIAIGVLILVFPELTVKVVIYVLGFWAVVIGAVQIFSALRQKKRAERYLLSLISGGLAAVFGLVLLVNPFEGAVALTLVVGMFSVMFGIFMLVSAIRLKRTLTENKDSPGV